MVFPVNKTIYIAGARDYQDKWMVRHFKSLQITPTYIQVIVIIISIIVVIIVIRQNIVMQEDR